MKNEIKHCIAIFGIILMVGQNCYAQWNPTGTGGYVIYNPIGVQMWPGLFGPSYQFESLGDARFWNGPGTTPYQDYIDLARPNGENGISFIQQTGERADLRFDGSNLKLVAGTTGYPPSANNGVIINTSGNVGIGITPVYKFHADGNVRFSNSGSSTNVIDFNRPNGENGFSLIQSFPTGGGPRADLRFDGTYLKLSAASSGTPTPEGGITLKTNGFVGLGNANPSYKFVMNDNSGSNFGSWINANSNGPALWIRKDNSGNSTSTSSTYTAINYSLGVENVSTNSQPCGALFSANYIGGSFCSGLEFPTDLPSATYTYYNIGITSNAKSPNASTNPIGVYTMATSKDNDNLAYEADGVISVAKTAISTYGVEGYGSSPIVSDPIAQDACGLYGSGVVYSSSGAINGNTQSRAMGVIGYAAGGYIDNSASPIIDQNWGGYFYGNVFASGTYLPSDQQFKTNIETLKNSLDIISKLNPKSYNYKQEDKYESFHFSKSIQYGLIAQELETILPELVIKSSSPEIKDNKGKIISNHINYRSVNYTSLIPILIGGIQEQQTKITSLENKILTIETILANKGIFLDQLNKVSDIKLEQNNPNPFTESSSISYFIPLESGVSTATIFVYDLTGKQLKKYNVSTLNGKGTVQIKSGELQPGSYYYSLICDDKLIDTKKMIIKD